MKKIIRHPNMPLYDCLSNARPDSGKLIMPLRVIVCTESIFKQKSFALRFVFIMQISVSELKQPLYDLQ